MSKNGKKIVLLGLTIVVALILAATAKSEVISQNPLVQVFGNIYAVYDVQLFNHAFHKYQTQFSDFQAGQLAHGVTWTNIEQRSDAALREIRNELGSDRFDAVFHQYGLNFAADQVSPIVLSEQ